MLATDMRHQTAPAEATELEHLASHDFKKFTQRAYRYLGNLEDAEDAVQEALLSAFKHLSDFRSRAKLSTWLTTIVINAARTQRRRRKPTLSYEQLLEAPVILAKFTQDTRPTPEEICANDELHRLVAQTADQLSPVCRRAVHVYLMHGFDTTAASDFLGIPLPTFKTQLARARKELKRRIATKASLSEFSEA
jgi:RNA polymerase sigma-70 factor (ECF subfamily)